MHFLQFLHSAARLIDVVVQDTRSIAQALVAPLVERYNLPKTLRYEAANVELVSLAGPELVHDVLDRVQGLLALLLVELVVFHHQESLLPVSDRVLHVGKILLQLDNWKVLMALEHEQIHSDEVVNVIEVLVLAEDLILRLLDHDLLVVNKVSINRTSVVCKLLDALLNHFFESALLRGLQKELSRVGQSVNAPVHAEVLANKLDYSV